MFRSLLIAMLLASTQALAVSKCVIAGKTVYQQTPCPEGTEKAMQGVSTVGSQGLRDEMAAKQVALDEEKSKEQQAYIEQLKIEAEMRPNSSTPFSEYAEINARREAARAKLYELGLRSKTDDKLDNINRKLNIIQIENMNERDQNAMRRYFPGMK